MHRAALDWTGLDFGSEKDLKEETVRRPDGDCNILQLQEVPPTVPYVGHLITADGLKPDPAKINAVQHMLQPNDKNGVRRFLGFVTYLSKFIPNLSEVDAPLHQLLE